jgi:hypothetical protein
VALLLPIPLFVAGGLRLPLPAAIERGLASLGSGGALDSTASEASPDDSEPDGGADVTGSAGTSAPAGDRQAASSSALIVQTEAAPAGDVEGVQTPGDRSTPDTGHDPPPPGADDPEGAPAPDGPAAPPRDTPPAPVQATAETAVDAGAPLEINLTEESVEVVVAGESVEVPGPDVPAPGVPVPVPAPPAPVPLPPLPVP